jgi:sugar lactone lactonase YvrE
VAAARIARATVLVALIGACALALAGPASARNRFDTRVFARIGDPGYPALSLVAPDRTVYVGTFTNAQGEDTGPSKVFAYSPDGRLKRTYVVQGQTPGAAHGVQVAAIDARGKLYLMDQNPPRVLTLDPNTGAQATYGTFRDVMPCAPGAPPQDCSATTTDNPAEPNYAAWGPDGSLYVTDYIQGLIWRVPAGGGTAHVWFTDPQLDGALFGPAGLLLTPDRHHLLVSTSAGGTTTLLAGNDPTTGELYSLPIENDGRPGFLTKLWESGPKEAPDGFALAKSGNVYLALVGPDVNQLVVIGPDGTERTRFPSDTSGDNGTDIPFDEPSSARFDGERLLVTNNPYVSGDKSHMAVFDVFVGEPGEPVFVPGLGGGGSGGYKLTVRPRKVRVGTRHTFRFHVTLRGRRVKDALVAFAGRRVRTDGRGHAKLRTELKRVRRYRATVSVGKSRLRVASASVRVQRRLLKPR